MSLFGNKRTDGRGPNTKSKAAAVVLSALMLWQSFGSYTPAYGITTGGGTSETQSEVAVDSQNESSPLEATNLDSAPLLRVSPGFNDFTITPTIENADVAYFAYHSVKDTQGVTSEKFAQAQNDVPITIKKFNWKNTTSEPTDWGDGYVLFFIKPKDGYLLTDIGASGAGDFYSLQDERETFDNIKDYPGLSNVVAAAKAAKAAGYIGVFGWCRHAGDNLPYEVTTAIKGQSPDLKVSAKSDKETVKPGDKLTFTVTLAPQKPDTKKDVTISDVKVNSATINGESVTISDLKAKDDGTYEGTVTYTVDQEAYAQGEVTLNVYASTTYSVKTSMQAGSSVTTHATITKDASCTCKVADQAAKYITLTGKNVSEVYDGQAHAAGTATATDKQGKTVTVEYKKAGDSWTTNVAEITATDVADSATVEVRASAPEYEGYVYADETLTVTARPVTVAANSKSAKYTGTELIDNGWTITSGEFVAGEGFESVTVEGSQLYVGSSDNVITGCTVNSKTKEKNYKFTFISGKLTVTDGSDIDPVDPSGVVTKTHDGTDFKLGATVTFTIEAKNIYDVAKTMTFSEIDGVTITGRATFENVQPGETVSTTATHIITEDDILAGKFVNTATVTFERGKSFDATDTATTEAKNGHITVAKKTVSSPVDGKLYKVGEAIKYEVTVTNDGNLTVSDITAYDKLTGDEWRISSLAPGESQTFTAQHVVDASDVAAGKVVNEAVANGTTSDPDNPNVPVTPGKTEDPVEVAKKSLVAVKTVTSKPADGKAYKVGETVNFEVKVTNNGNQTLADIKVNDQLAGAKLAAGESATIEKLAPGETATLHYSYTIQQSDLGHSFKNVVTAKASDGTAATTESETVPVADAEKKSETKKSTDKKSTDKKTGTPKTGDVLLGGGAIAAIAGTGVFGVVASRIRRKK